MVLHHTTTGAALVQYRNIKKIEKSEYNSNCGNKAHRPAFFSSGHRIFMNSPSPTNSSTIFISHQQFGQNTGIMAQLSHSVSIGDGSAHCGNTVGSFNTTVNTLDEDAQLVSWLSPLALGNRHRGVRTDRVDRAGDWFLEISELREWGGEGGTDGAVLSCPRNPRVGKTYLR